VKRWKKKTLLYSTAAARCRRSDCSGVGQNTIHNKANSRVRATTAPNTFSQ
jgi:hypothetical protein